MNSLDSSRSPRPSGFTLIELIGTLAILALLAWITTEGVFVRLKESLRRDEEGSLRELAEALRSGVVRERAFPAETNWAPFIAVELARPMVGIQKNPAGWSRRLIFDPDFRLGSPMTTPPYQQTSSGSPPVSHARALLVSSLADDLPNLSVVSFDDLWACPPSCLPTHWPDPWAGQPTDVLIERVGFRPLFCQLYLNNLNQDGPAQFAIDSTNQTEVIPPGGHANATYIVSSQLLLLGTDGTLQQSIPLNENCSFAFEAGHWRRGFASGLGNATSPLAAGYDRFAGLPAAALPASPAEVALAMHELMGEFNRWSRDGFATSSSLVGQPAPSFRRMKEASARLDDFAGLLLGENPGTTP